MILMFDKTGWFNENFRIFFGGIDAIIYHFISWILEGIFKITRISGNPEFIKILFFRAYLILGVFMIFKLTFSFINYMINPDSMLDKQKGVAKVISRTIIMVCMLLIANFVFFDTSIFTIKDESGNKKQVNILTKAQEGIIKTLPKLILGLNGNSNEDTASEALDNGEQMAASMISAFYYESEDKDISETGVNSIVEFEQTLTSTKDKNTYKYKYLWPMSTVAGIMLVIILLGIAIDVSIRVFKIIILEMIAPVPIISYIDPKSSGDGSFGKWLKTFATTYTSIFLKLGSVYILLLLFSKLLDEDEGVFEGGLGNIATGRAKNFVYVLLIIGLFKFAKDAPKFLSDALGLKGDGEGGIFKNAGSALGTFGGAALGTLAGATGAMSAAKARFQNAETGKQKAGAIFGGAAGLLTGTAGGMFRGGYNGMKGGKDGLTKGLGGAINAQNAVTQRKLAAAAGGSTIHGRLGARMSNFLTGETAADRDEKKLAALKEAKDSAAAFDDSLASTAAKSDAELLTGSKGPAFSLKQFNANLTAANNGDASAKTWLSDRGFASMADANASAKKMEKDYKKNLYTGITAGSGAKGDAKRYRDEIIRVLAATPGETIDNNKDFQGILSAGAAAEESRRGLGLKDSRGDDIGPITGGNVGDIKDAAAKAINDINASRKHTARKSDAKAISRGK